MNEPATPKSSTEEEHPTLVVRDRRRIDPVTGQLRRPPAETPVAGSTAGAGEQAGAGGPAAPLSTDTPDVLQAQLAERTADLQRLQAEYANYRKRVGRDRQAARDLAVAAVLAELVPVLDAIGRARAAGELTGGFKSVAESLEARLSKLGLQRFGEVGDEYDPRIHEGFTHVYSDEVDRQVCVEMVLPGYRIGDRLLRPAQVVVADPTAPFGAAEEVGDQSGPPRRPADQPGSAPASEQGAASRPVGGCDR